MKKSCRFHIVLRADFENFDCIAQHHIHDKYPREYPRNDIMPSVPQLFKWSPRPDDHQPQTPNPSGSPNPFDTPASQSSSRFNPFSNVRSMINGSSIYSRSPNVDSATSHSPFTTPKTSFLDRFRREHPPAPIAVPDPNDPPRESTDSSSPLQPPHTAGSYMRTIAPLADPREAEGRTIYSAAQNGAALNRHPADVPLDYGGSGAGENMAEREESPEEINERRRRSHRKRRRQTRNRNDAWVRSRKERRCCTGRVKNTAARGKMMACIISGLFLVTVLGICKVPTSPHRRNKTLTR